MHQLVQLAHHIHNYNLRGSNRLSPIKLIVLYTKSHVKILDQIIDQFKCEKSGPSFQLLGLSGYNIMRSSRILGLQVHLLCSLLDEENISDQMFLRRKKIIQKLRCSKETIFICLQTTSIPNFERSQILQLKRVDSSVCKDISWKGNIQIMCYDIVKLWESIHRFQVIVIIANLKQLIKNIENGRKRQLQWIQVLFRRSDQLSYAFQLINVSSQYLSCSLQGYYSREAHNFQNEFSVHWQIMDVFEDLWRQQGEKINRQLQRMPLSYIGESLKMSSCHSLGGFLPQSCFLQVFQPILEQLAENILQCLQGAKFKVMQSVQTIYEYYFTKTSIKQQILQFQLKKVEQICEKFLKQVQNAIYSQISYVYAPSQSFWQMRSVKSNLYSEQQQANIEVKYIGKVYVKKVYDSLKESIPRYIGQGLLRKVSKYFRENALNNLLQIVKQSQFYITLSQRQIQQIKYKNALLKDYDKLFQYFSLKVSSTFKIKNLLEKNEKRWKQMYKRQRKQQGDMRVVQGSDQKGLIGWIKRIFKSDQKRQKRSQSSQKVVYKQQKSIKDNIQSKEQKVVKAQELQIAISDKQWILIINTNKKVDQQRLFSAAIQGFPERLRPAIWYWFAKRSFQQKQLKISQILEKGKIQDDTARQIEKDLSRTPPPQLFKVRLRSSLRKVLSAYSVIDEQIKYTQGMNFIAAIALTTFLHWGTKDDYLKESADKQNLAELQEKSFMILKYIMLKQGFRKIMLIERDHIAELCFRIQENIKKFSEKVWNIIKQSGFTCQIIFGPILLSGLSTWSKKMQVCKRIMDIFICRGFTVLFKIVAGVAIASEPQLIKLKNQQIYDFLRNKAIDEYYQRTGEEGLTQLFSTI